MRWTICCTSIGEGRFSCGGLPAEAAAVLVAVGAGGRLSWLSPLVVDGELRRWFWRCRAAADGGGLAAAARVVENREAAAKGCSWTCDLWRWWWRWGPRRVSRQERDAGIASEEDSKEE
jgi:hypothetical protein